MSSSLVKQKMSSSPLVVAVLVTILAAFLVVPTSGIQFQLTASKTGQTKTGQTKTGLTLKKKTKTRRRMHHEALLFTSASLSGTSELAMLTTERRSEDQQQISETARLGHVMKTTMGQGQTMNSVAKIEHVMNSTKKIGYSMTHSSMTSSTLKTKKGLTKMGIIHKTAYWGEITLGGQVFSVIFDTGSGNLIIPQKNCKGSGCDCHRKYDPDHHSDHRSKKYGKYGIPDHQYGGVPVMNSENENEAEISFGTGDVAGQFYRDDLCFGTKCFPIDFLASFEQSEEPFSNTPFDGILGLGFSDLSMGKGFNVVDEFLKLNGEKTKKDSEVNETGDKILLTTMTGKKIDPMNRSMFSFAITDDGPSSVTFGGYRKSLMASPVLWAPVTVPSYWQIPIDDITLDNQLTGLCNNMGNNMENNKSNNNGCQVAVDTGTSMLAGPTELINSLSNSIRVAADCSNYKNLPNLGFKIGDKILNLRPEEYVDNDADRFCNFSLMALDVPPPKGPLFIFGDPFLRRFVTVFDRQNMRVGFAAAKLKGVESNKDMAIIKYMSKERKNSKKGREKVGKQHTVEKTGDSDTDRDNFSTDSDHETIIRLSAGMMHQETGYREDSSTKSEDEVRPKSDDQARNDEIKNEDQDEAKLFKEVEEFSIDAENLNTENQSCSENLNKQSFMQLEVEDEENLVTIELHKLT